MARDAKRKLETNNIWRKNNPEKVQDSYRRYREKHSAELKIRSKAARAKRKEYYDEQNKAYAREWKRKLRTSIIERMGGKCVRCGFADHRALQVDHIHGGGEKERRSYANLYQFFKTLAVNIDSSKYQLLCANCNTIKRIENGEHRTPSR